MFTKAIAASLKAHWPACKIYTEAVRQYLDGPCFVIQEISGNHTANLGTSRTLRYQYAVYFYGKEEKQVREAASQMGTELCFVLDEITHQGSVYRNTGMEFQILEDALLFTVGYAYRCRLEAEQEMMETMQHKVEF